MFFKKRIFITYNHFPLLLLEVLKMGEKNLGGGGETQTLFQTLGRNVNKTYNPVWKLKCTQIKVLEQKESQLILRKG